LRLLRLFAAKCLPPSIQENLGRIRDPQFT
jgi:hypothetical protein